VSELLHWTDEGPRDAPVVVLLHSLATHGGLWMPQRVVWQQRWRVVTIDLPGHGGSAAAALETTLAGMAGRVVAVLDALGIHSAAWVGLSLGGMVAQAVALQHPHRVQRLVVAHAGARTDAAVREIWNQRIAQFASEGMDALVESTLQRWFPRAFAEQAPLTLAWVAGLVRSVQPAGYIAAIQAIQGLDHLEQLTALHVPTLVVAGTVDAAVPATVAGLLAQRLPRARLCILEGVGHIGNVQDPHGFTETVGAFLQEEGT
jgi:3-oxoadipate enol-lactonase